MRRRTFVISGVASGVGLAAAALPAYAQASPPRSATGIIGGKTIYVNYYSPSMRGRLSSAACLSAAPNLVN